MAQKIGQKAISTNTRRLGQTIWEIVTSGNPLCNQKQKAPKEGFVPFCSEDDMNAPLHHVVILWKSMMS